VERKALIEDFVSQHVFMWVWYHYNSRCIWVDMVYVLAYNQDCVIQYSIIMSLLPWQPNTRTSASNIGVENMNK